MIYLIRHCHYEPRLSLDGDGPLSDKGKIQAQRLADRLIAEKVDFKKVYTSPLIRASESADILCVRLGIERPAIYLNLAEEGEDETREEVISRMKTFFNTVKNDSEKEHIAAFGHSFAIKYFLNSISQNKNRTVLPHGGIALIDNSKLVCRILDDYDSKSHLSEIETY